MSFSHTYSSVRYKQADDTWSTSSAAEFHLDENDNISSVEIDGKKFDANALPASMFIHVDPTQAIHPVNTFWLIAHENKLFKCDYNPNLRKVIKAVPVLAKSKKGKTIAITELVKDIELNDEFIDVIVKEMNDIQQKQTELSDKGTPILEEEVLEETIDDSINEQQGEQETKPEGTASVENHITNEDTEVRAPDPVKKMNLIFDDNPINDSPVNEETYQAQLAAAIEASTKESTASKSSPPTDNDDLNTAIRLSLEESSTTELTLKQANPIQVTPTQVKPSVEKEVTPPNNTSTKDTDLEMTRQRSLQESSSVIQPTEQAKNSMSLATQSQEDVDLAIAIERSLKESTATPQTTSKIDLVPEARSNKAPVKTQVANNTTENAFSLQEIKNTMDSLMRLAINNLNITVPALAGVAFAIAGFSIALAGLGLSAAASIGIGLTAGAVASAVGFFAVKQLSSLAQQDATLENRVKLQKRG